MILYRINKVTAVLIALAMFPLRGWAASNCPDLVEKILSSSTVVATEMDPQFAPFTPQMTREVAEYVAELNRFFEKGGLYGPAARIQYNLHMLSEEAYFEPSTSPTVLSIPYSFTRPIVQLKMALLSGNSKMTENMTPEELKKFDDLFSTLPAFEGDMVQHEVNVLNAVADGFEVKRMTREEYLGKDLKFQKTIAAHEFGHAILHHNLGQYSTFYNAHRGEIAVAREVSDSPKSLDDQKNRIRGIIERMKAAKGVLVGVGAKHPEKKIGTDRSVEVMDKLITSLDDFLEKGQNVHAARTGRYGAIFSFHEFFADLSAALKLRAPVPLAEIFGDDSKIPIIHKTVDSRRFNGDRDLNLKDWVIDPELMGAGWFYHSMGPSRDYVWRRWSARPRTDEESAAFLKCTLVALGSVLDSLQAAKSFEANSGLSKASEVLSQMSEATPASLDAAHKTFRKVNQSFMVEFKKRCERSAQ